MAAANFYAGRLITPGTLLAVFLATSDEALPILISQPGALPDLLLLLGVKLVSGTVFGVLADILWKRLRHTENQEPFSDLCRDCDCEHQGIFKSALIHTLRIALFLFIINLLWRGHSYGGGGRHFPATFVRQRFPAPVGGADRFYSQLRCLGHFDRAVLVRLSFLWSRGGRAVHGSRGGPGGIVQGKPSSQKKISCWPPCSM